MRVNNLTLEGNRKGGFANSQKKGAPNKRLLTTNNNKNKNYLKL